MGKFNVAVVDQFEDLAGNQLSTNPSVISGNAYPGTINAYLNNQPVSDSSYNVPFSVVGKTGTISSMLSVNSSSVNNPGITTNEYMEPSTEEFVTLDAVPAPVPYTDPQQVVLTFTKPVENVAVTVIDQGGDPNDSDDVYDGVVSGLSSDATGTIWTLTLSPIYDPGQTDDMQNGAFTLAVSAEDVATGDPIVTLPFDQFGPSGIPIDLLPRPIAADEAQKMSNAGISGDITAGDFVLDDPDDFNFGDSNSRGYYLDNVAQLQTDFTNNFVGSDTSQFDMDSSESSQDGVVFSGDVNFDFEVGTLTAPTVPTPEPSPDPNSPDGQQALSDAQSGQSLNEGSATLPAISIPLPNLGFSVPVPITMPSFAISIPDIGFDPTDLNASLNSLSSVTPNSLANMAMGAVPGASDVNSLIGQFTCGGSGLSSLLGLSGPLSAMSNFIHQQMAPITNAINALPPGVQNAVHLQVIASGAGAVMAKDYIANGRNNQLSNGVTNGVQINDADLNSAFQSVDRFVAVDAPFLGQDPVLQKELNEIKQLLATGQATATAVLAILAPTPPMVQTGAMGSGMSLADIVKFATQLAQLRCDINNLSSQWNEFKENSNELINQVNETIPSVLNGSAEKEHWVSLAE